MASEVDLLFSKLMAFAFYHSLTFFSYNEVRKERKRGNTDKDMADMASRIIKVQRAQLLTSANYSVVSGVDKGTWVIDISNVR